MAASFADKLRELRLRANISQNTLARRVGVNASYINRIESGEREPPRRDIVVEIASVLGLEERERDELLLSAGYAPEIATRVDLANPVFRLMAEAIEDVDTEPEILAQQLIDLLRRHREQP